MGKVPVVVVGELVDYQINPKMVRPAVVMDVDTTGEILDLRVFVKAGDFPEFSQAECQHGTPYRAGVKYGDAAGCWNERG